MNFDFKKSRYNYVLPYGEGYLLFNSLNFSLIYLSKLEYQNYLEDSYGINSDETKTLIDGGFIVDCSINEKYQYLYHKRKQSFNASSLNLTIAPTLSCNFCCDYCYEKEAHSKAKMSRTTCQNLISFIKKKVESENLNEINIVWYGGEPLLEVQTIDFLSKNIVDYVKKNGLDYNAFMVTNGYLLDDEAIAVLTEYKINNIQVTIDGNKTVHNQRRKLLNGNGTYDKIISNLCLLDSKGISVGLRINIDKTNQTLFYNLLDDLKKYNLKDYVFPYLGFTDYSFGDINNKEISTIQFNRIIQDFNQRWYGDSYQTDFQNVFCKRMTFCGADTSNSFVISPEGDMYKCWNDIGMQNLIIGNISSGLIYNDVLSFYMNYNPFEDSLCSDCEFLPMCGGGCPSKRRRNTYRCGIKGEIIEAIPQLVMQNSEK